MNPLYFLVLLPLLAPLVALQLMGRFNTRSLPIGAAVSVGGALLVVLTIWLFASHTPSDTETLNGFITTKEIHRFNCPVNTSNPCRNGYDCHCRVITYSCGTDKSPQTCSRTECDRCYQYAWERDFYLDSSLQGERAYKINRVDSQGAIEPPRWTATHHGDPVSITHSYKNYILGAADSLFAQDGAAEAKYKTKLPVYPQNIYDYYKMDRLVTVGNVKVDRRRWNEEISKALVQVGTRKEGNIVVVIAEGVGMDFANAVRRSWKGFKKNDIVIFAGVDGVGNLTWVRTMSWSKLSLVNVAMENELLQQFESRPLEPVSFMATAKAVSLAHFQRRSMEDFSYLKADTKLSGGQMTALILLVLLIPTGLIVWLFYLTEGMYNNPEQRRFLASYPIMEKIRAARPRGFSSSNARVPPSSRSRFRP